MRASHHSARPFDMLVDPEAVLRALAGSSRLQCLKGKICRPLDKPLIPASSPPEVAEFDGTVDDTEGDMPV